MQDVSLLKQIQLPNDLRKLDAPADLVHLAAEIRQFLIETLSKIEHAHFSASLGTVELTLALHYCFNTPKDLLIWDTGHQAYVHKIITGRKDQISRIRTQDGIAGFLSRSESEYDVFGAGHAGTSISAALGAAIASNLAKKDLFHIAVIGDASISSGMAFEALNHLAEVKNINLLIVLNDNERSIDPTVGGLSAHFKQQKTQTHYSEFFSALQLNYRGPIDGHDVQALMDSFETYKNQGGVQVLHVKTVKGKGFEPAEKGSAAHWHAPGAFVPEFVDLEKKASTNKRYQDIFADKLIDLARENKSIMAVSAGMLSGTSLHKFQEVFPTRTFDVGIAEQHAVTLSAGMATQGLIPFCALYSTFLQRALDQVIHDVAIQNLPVVFCVDRAGVVGHDGATHQGVFDLSFLLPIPNLTIAMPSHVADLEELLTIASTGNLGPMVIRYPRGVARHPEETEAKIPLQFGKSKTLQASPDITILAFGPLLHEAKKVRTHFEKLNLKTGLVDVIFAKPLDIEMLHEVFLNSKQIITLEENSAIGGFGAQVCQFKSAQNYPNPVLNIGISDEFVQHASQEQQRKALGLDSLGIIAQINSFLAQNS